MKLKAVKEFFKKYWFGLNLVLIVIAVLYLALLLVPKEQPLTSQEQLKKVGAVEFSIIPIRSSDRVITFSMVPIFGWKLMIGNKSVTFSGDFLEGEPSLFILARQEGETFDEIVDGYLFELKNAGLYNLTSEKARLINGINVHEFVYTFIISNRTHDKHKDILVEHEKDFLVIGYSVDAYKIKEINETIVFESTEKYFDRYLEQVEESISSFKLK